MNTSMTNRIFFSGLLLALALAFCAAPACADYQVQYGVGFGVYYPYAGDTTSTSPGEGLLALNGSHRTLIQLIWAGPNGVADHKISFGGSPGGDDVLLDSRIIEAGVNGVDEWGYTSSLPPPYISTNSAQKPVFVRVHQDDTPSSLSCWYDSPLIYPEDIGRSTLEGCFATILHVENGSEILPTTGVRLDQTALLDTIQIWFPDPPPTNSPAIRNIDFDPEAAGFTFSLPYSYSLHAVYGADAVLPTGDWNWQPLTEGTDYTVTNGVVTLLTTGAGVAPRNMIRIGLHHDF